MQKFIQGSDFLIRQDPAAPQILLLMKIGAADPMETIFLCPEKCHIITAVMAGMSIFDLNTTKYVRSDDLHGIAEWMCLVKKEIPFSCKSPELLRSHGKKIIVFPCQILRQSVNQIVILRTVKTQFITAEYLDTVVPARLFRPVKFLLIEIKKIPSGTFYMVFSTSPCKVIGDHKCIIIRGPVQCKSFLCGNMGAQRDPGSMNVHINLHFCTLSKRKTPDCIFSTCPGSYPIREIFF